MPGEFEEAHDADDAEKLQHVVVLVEPGGGCCVLLCVVVVVCVLVAWGPV